MRASFLTGRALLLILTSLLIGACDDSPTSPSAIPAFSQTDVRVGAGAEATLGKVVSVNYTGWLYDESRPDQKGAQFDTSIGREEFVFTLGIGQVIEGWDRGVSGMKVGGMRRLVVPPSLGYGNFRNGPIPPNAPLLFEIELLAVQ